MSHEIFKRNSIACQLQKISSSNFAKCIKVNNSTLLNDVKNCLHDVFLNSN